MKASFLHPASSYDELWSQVDFPKMDIPEQFNLGVACVDDHDPDAIALTVVAKDQSHESYTFGQVKEQSNRLANALAGLGIGRGDVVGVVKPASFETAVAYMALFRMGAITLPLSSLFGPDALAFRLRHGEAKAVITSAENAGKVREATGGDEGIPLLIIGGQRPENAPSKPRFRPPAPTSSRS